MNLIKSIWEQIPSWDDLGGRISRKNYGNQPIVDRDTDVDAQEYNSLALTTAQIARTSPFCVLQASFGGDSTYTVDWVTTQGGVTGPTVSRVSEGVYRLTFPASLPDQAGRSAATNLGCGVATVSYNDTGVVMPVANVISPTVVEIRLHNVAASGAPLVDPFISLTLVLWSAT